MGQLIRREEALEIMWNLADGDYTDSESANEDIKRQYERMLNLPIIESRPTGEWIDHSEDGYAECPFCRSATNCDDNIEELNYCWSCGAELFADMGGKKMMDNITAEIDTANFLYKNEMYKGIFISDKIFIVKDNGENEDIKDWLITIIKKSVWEALNGIQIIER